MRDYLFPPLILPLFVVLILLPVLLIFFIFTTSAVFEVVFGIGKREAMLIFMMIAVGSFINIPIYEKEGSRVEYVYDVFGFIYAVRRRGKIVVAVNLGGCIFPAILAAKALADSLRHLDAAVVAASMFFATVASYRVARPVRGVGIVMPMIAPPLIAVSTALIAVLMSGSGVAILPKLSFAIGVFSTLVGADILHLPEIEKVGDGVVSIGGAGTFDGIFLTGVFAVLFSLFLF